VGGIACFGLFDAFLEFFLKDFSKEGSSLDEEERFEVVEGFAEGGVFGDEIALVEKGVKLLCEEVANVGRGGCHKILPCKRGLLIKRTSTLYTTPTNFGHTLSVISDVLIYTVNDINGTCHMQTIPAFDNEISSTCLSQIVVGILTTQTLCVLVEFYTGCQKPYFALWLRYIYLCHICSSG
jgi:hypothetical protein